MVSGYFIDTVATSSGAPADEFLYVSNWDRYFGEIGDKFMALSEKDQSVRTHFGCDPAAVALRVALGTLLMDIYQRRLIPPLVYRLNRCNSNDVDVLTHFVESLNALREPVSESAYISTLLYYLIVYSEMWEKTTPDQQEMTARFMGSRISTGLVYQAKPSYCAFSKEKSDSCDEFEVGNYAAKGIIYERDQYWNKTATIPNNTSDLMCSGGLDPQTPPYVAESFFRALEGDNKELVSFDYIPHSSLGSSFMVDGDQESSTCGIKLLASYIMNDGDLKRLNRTCLDEMPPFSLTIPLELMHSFMRTDDTYDGIYKTSLSIERPQGMGY
ncbi:hypothetical protein F442_09713 [Phytophthora nicotianae P10297]|uniref:Peptidase S33 tripeptidyl aminopeptidase-like C-terminal domain-containing protein n=1 Tax=Phytophthora nicotianae P10297 TaxID=1317064 RepID=W2Z8Y5_PHYNI|nr:hypothetical protein F442_09713 [Phytophthora nicotianae P10297]